jgi:hypothetical protein
MIVAFLPLCKGCFLQIKLGKLAVLLKLRDGLGTAKSNVTTSKINFPLESRSPDCLEIAVVRK